ncbi:MAG: peptide-methionine (R)-S-oxide reductase MsrB [Proteocatella sp.]
MNNKSGKYKKPLESILKQKLTSIQYEVTQNSATENPFHNEYWDFFEKGIYVDIVTGEPLFLSVDKFSSSCGWPSFSKPISEDAVTYFKDRSFGMIRIEVRSKIGDSHLGHVFDDGPAESGGRRFCINSAAIKFIALNDMESSGYGEYENLIRNIQ